MVFWVGIIMRIGLEWCQVYQRIGDMGESFQSGTLSVEQVLQVR